MTATAILKLPESLIYPCFCKFKGEQTVILTWFSSPFLPETTEDAYQDIFNTAQKMNDILEEAIDSSRPLAVASQSPEIINLPCK